MTGNLSAYLPQDRRRALARGEDLPNRTAGAALFADISGFTLLTETLTRALGQRGGAEALTDQLDAVYDALIAAVERFGGSVVGFAGDAITCWFDENDESRGMKDEDTSASLRAVVCALAMQTAIRDFSAIALPDGAVASLALKAAVASGPARRLVVGDPEIQRLDVLAGATVARTAAAEHLAGPGEVLVDAATAEALQGSLRLAEWREDPQTGEQFGVVGDFGAGREHVSPIGERRLDQDQDEEASAPERWQGWLLPAVYARERAGQGAFLTEFRPAATLFLRFTGIDYERDEAGVQLDAFIRQVQAALARYEGVLLQLTIGDKGSYLYAAFGAPIAHEDDARRAVKAALDLKSLAAQLDFLEPVQIGISQGRMRTGAYGGSGRRTYGVLGDDVNLAARLMAQAVPGEILVSGRVQLAVSADFASEPRPHIPVKGKTEPLPVFVVTGARQRRAIRLQEPTYALPMVGRQSELQVIVEKMALALDGKGQVVGIMAEAGLGKSRLVAEVIRAARRHGFVGYGGPCQSDGINSPYLVWKTIVSAFFDVDPELPLRKQARWLEREIEDLAPARLDALPLLGAVLGLPMPENDFTRGLEPKNRKSALHALLEDSLKAAAREEPLLLVFEDMHWIDALSHNLLEEVALATSALPVFIVLAYRPPQLQRLQSSRLERLPHFTKIELAELSPAECEQAIRAKLAQLYPARGESAPPALSETLAARSQGNPFFLEELLNYLRDRGLDPFDPAALDKIELPDSLHALILSRIDQLAESEKLTLRVASIVGRLFRAAWLPGYFPTLGPLSDVKADLDELDRLEITPLDTPEPELAYLFKHIVTHEVTYESLPYATRAQLHEQLARYLEVAYAEAPPLDTLAYHYGQSANVDKQREYFHKAGDAARAAFANDAALAYFARLRPLLDAPSEQVDLYLKWGEVLELMGRWHEAETHYRDALTQAAGDPVRMARCQLALGKLGRLHGDSPAALDWLEKARQAFEALDDHAGMVLALSEASRVNMLRAEYATARQRLQEALALAPEALDKLSRAEALNSLGVLDYYEGNYAAARERYEQSLALRREMRDKPGMASTLNNLGLVGAVQGDFSAARTLYGESLALWRELGDKRGMATTLHNLGLVAAEQGDYSAAQALGDESLALRREMGDKPGTASTLNSLGLLAATQGNYAVAQTYYEEGLVLQREMNSKRGFALSLQGLGVITLLQGDHVAARVHLEESLSLRHEIGDKPGIAVGLACLADAAQQAGASSRAVRLAAAAESLRIGLQLVFESLERHVLAETLASARAVLGDEDFGRAWEEGERLSLGEAVALALAPLPR